MADDEPDRTPATQQDPPADSPAAPTSLPPMPPQPFPGTFPPPPGLDDILRAAGSPGALAPPVPRARRPPMTTERYDEKCWTSTRQTNARRALGREPAVTMYCYLNMRHALENMIPVPGHPTAFLARDAPLDEHVPVKPAAERPEGTPEYHCRWLDGRFIYIARGRENVARHMREMGGVAADSDAKRDAGDGAGTVAAEGPKAGRVKRKLMPAADEERLGAWETISRIEDRVEKERAEKLLPNKREEAMLRRAMGFDDESSESLISLSDAYSNTLQRLHAHTVRIYSPGLKNLARVPQVWTDGTATQMLDTVTTRLTDGSAFKLAGRLWDSLGNVHGQLEERRKRRGSGESDGGPFGGVQPPAPPLPPLPPVGSARSAEPGVGPNASTGDGQDGAENAPSPRQDSREPSQRVYHVACTVM
ncbi:hypothetical protein JCM3770_002146 [Rhodotorula araucariae]